MKHHYRIGDLITYVKDRKAHSSKIVSIGVVAIVLEDGHRMLKTVSLW